MTSSGQVILRAGAKLYLPCVALFALALVAAPLAGLARGLAGGLALGLGFALHVIVMGAQAAQRAAPRWLLRALVASGLAASAAAAAAPPWRYGEIAGVLAIAFVTAGALGLTLAVLAARAATLRDEEW